MDASRPLVLYVDRDDNCVSQAVANLEPTYRVIRAIDDEQACGLLRDYQQLLRAVVIDVELPGSVVSGIQLARAFRKRLRAEQLPSFATQLPELSQPLFLLCRSPLLPQDVVREQLADGFVRKPLGLGALSLALAGYHLAARQ